MPPDPSTRRGPVRPLLLAALVGTLLVGATLPATVDAPADLAPAAAHVPADTAANTTATSPGHRASTRTQRMDRPTARPRGKRPNLLVVMMDDARVDDLRFAPNVRRYVTDRGLRFANSFSPYPLCCPARASFVTGKYAHNHRVLYHADPYGFGTIDDSVSVATALQRAGYLTGFTGKYLNRYGVQNSLVTGRPSVSYVPNGWTDWRAGLDTEWGSGSPYAGNTYNYFSFTQNVNGATVANTGRYSSAVIGADAREMARGYQRSSRPWFLWVNPVAPHHGVPVEEDDPAPYVSPEGRVQAFPTPARPDWVKDRFDREIPRAPGVPAVGPVELDMRDKPSFLRRVADLGSEERERLTEVARQRAESVYAWDVQFGRMVRQLQRDGEWRNTIVLVTSDNGYFQGEHRLRVGKIKAYEPSLRVPMVVAGPGIPHGVRYQPITTIDVTRTLLDLAGAPTAALPETDGESKKDVLLGRDRPWTYPVLTEGLLTSMHGRARGFGSGLTEIGIRTGRYKLVKYANGARELYDLREDPLELQSRHADPRYQRIETRLDRIWRRMRDCTGRACQRPLPRDLQVGVPDLRRLHRLAATETRAYYGTP